VDTYRQKVAFYLDDSETMLGKLIDFLLMGFNVLACVLFVISSYQWNKLAVVTVRLEQITVTIFIIEYLMRLWASEKRLRFIFSFYGLIDIISIIPSFITARELTFLRALKVLRILRFIRYLETQTFFFGRLTKLQLQASRTIFTLMIILFVASGFIFYTEGSSANGQIATFGQAFYFCVITLTTVGFGDFVPVTEAGRAITVIMILGGVILIPWQAGRLVKVLIDTDPSKRLVTCKNCGLMGHDFDASHCKACGSVVYQEYSGEA
jgi:voltage-gated potassium channel